MSEMIATMSWSLRQVEQVGRLWTEAKIDAAYIYGDREGVIEATERKLADWLKREAHPYAVEIDFRDVQFAHEDVDMPPGIRIRAYWQPRTQEVEFVGGFNDGRTAMVARVGDPYRLPLPTPSFDPEAPLTARLPTATYELDGWSETARRWVYRLRSEES